MKCNGIDLQNVVFCTLGSSYRTKDVVYASQFPHDSEGYAGVVMFDGGETSQLPHDCRACAGIASFERDDTLQRPHWGRISAGIVTYGERKTAGRAGRGMSERKDWKEHKEQGRELQKEAV